MAAADDVAPRSGYRTRGRSYLSPHRLRLAQQHQLGAGRVHLQGHGQRGSSARVSEVDEHHRKPAQRRVHRGHGGFGAPADSVCRGVYGCLCLHERRSHVEPAGLRYAERSGVPDPQGARPPLRVHIRPGHILDAAACFVTHQRRSKRQPPDQTARRHKDRNAALSCGLLCVRRERY